MLPLQHMQNQAMCTTGLLNNLHKNDTKHEYIRNLDVLYALFVLLYMYPYPYRFDYVHGIV